MCVSEWEGVCVPPLHTSSDKTWAVTFVWYVPLGAEPEHRLTMDVLRGDRLLKAIEQDSHTEKFKSSHRAPGSLSLASLWSKRTLCGPDMMY